LTIGYSPIPAHGCLDMSQKVSPAVERDGREAADDRAEKACA
jgi:hypothetical protein